ncbi:MAG: phosphoglucomutase/phosphomannomutase family protein [Coriobacteriales bacterium]|nr:phosphoglucomutase/phosphomannomutase family protein [Coriobacteriales bacterium]
MSKIHFGTDGWRAIIGEDFTDDTLKEAVGAAARVFRAENPLDANGANMANQGAANTIIIGYDCRSDAARYAAIAADTLAAYGFDVKLSDTYCPTPTLCWSVAQDDRAIGGVILTSSHNPAEYLGVKLRMPDGGASPAAFTDKVEAELDHDDSTGGGAPSCATGTVCKVDLMTPYLDDLISLVDAEAIAAADLHVVVDPLYGAGRHYLADTLRKLGVTVEEVNNATDPTFGGLHPEPIEPWIQVGQHKVAELGYDACFFTDGDADRIGGADVTGKFVNPHRILTLVIAHLVEDKDKHGRVVRTLSGSNLVKRQCERLGLELTTTPIGFKWIYEQMLKGDVLVGGEESGGIGIPTHVRERDGLLMALLLTELMAQKHKTLKQLVDDMLTELGNLEFARRDLRLEQSQKDAFIANHSKADTDANTYAALFEPLGERIVDVDHRDGVKITFENDDWLLMRPSGTEPLVRVYAEAPTMEHVDKILDVGCSIAKGEEKSSVF